MICLSVPVRGMPCQVSVVLPEYHRRLKTLFRRPVGVCAVQHLTRTWHSCVIPSNAAATCARISCPATSGSELSMCFAWVTFSIRRNVHQLGAGRQTSRETKASPTGALTHSHQNDWVLGRLRDDLLNSAIETDAISG